MIWPKPLAGLTLAGLLLSACAGTEPERDHRHRAAARPAPVISAEVFVFLPYDADHDHRITKGELEAAITGAWREVAGSRSSVRLLELQDWFNKVEGAAATPFNPMEFAADNGDSVTRDEFATALTRRFRALDKNHDAVLEPSEFMVIPRVPRERPDDDEMLPPGDMRERRGGRNGPY